MRKITLYVSKYLPDKSFGMAEGKQLIGANLKTLGKNWDEAGLFSIGRFVCMTFEKTTDSPEAMLIIDMRKRPELLKGFLGDSEAGGFLIKHRAFLETYNAGYDSAKDVAEIAPASEMRSGK